MCSSESGVVVDDVPSATTSNQTNPIWNYFVKDDPEAGTDSRPKHTKKNKNVSCKLCTDKFQHSYGNTSTYRRHLERKHYSQFLIYCKKENEWKKQKLSLQSSKAQTSQQKICQFFKAKETYGDKHPKNLSVTKAIAKWMVESLHPFTLVEEPGFLKVMELADEKLNIPTATTYSRNIVPELYQKTLTNIKSTIETEKPMMGSLSVTTDMWTSKATKSYLAVTVHFITHDFSLASYCLACEYVADSHTGLKIGEVLMNVLREWGLSKQNFGTNFEIFCITDNAGNMKTALGSTDLTRLSCFAHTLNLVIKDVKRDYQGFDSLMAKCRAIVGHFRHSPTAKASLHTRLERMGLAPLELIHDVETRWNSEYAMMNRFLQVKDGLVVELSQPSCKVDNLSSSEWKLVAAYVEILKPVFDATVAVSSEKKPTRSLLIPIIYGLEKNLEEVISGHRSGVTLAKTLLKCLKSRFPLYMEAYPDQISMFVDPRFKNHCLPDHLGKSLEAKVKKALVELAKANQQTQNEQSLSTPEIGPSTSNSGNASQTHRATSSLFAAFETAETQKNPNDEIDLKGNIEIQAYLNEPRILLTEDPFQWWRTNGLKYSLLSKVARKYLGIAATEVASERVFSGAGNVVTKNRTRLTAENTERLVFLHQNLKNVSF